MPALDGRNGAMMVAPVTKAVFTTKLSPSYDDLPERWYHFPRTYLRAVEQAVGDFIIYYEPRRGSIDLSSRGGRQSYFAVARLVRIDEDRLRQDHFYARVEDYLSFDTAVPFRAAKSTYELGLSRADGATNKGAFGRAVRLLSDDEFEAILQAGFRQDVWDPPARPAQHETEFAEESSPFVRAVVTQTTQRPFRDLAFRRGVRRAYENRCAMTGLALINGGGRPEVQAAHIMPVADSGPDSIRNGLALSGTMHWLFDRGLITIAPDYGLVLANDAVPDAIRVLLNPDGKMRLPVDPADHPHPRFLQHHREVVAAGKAWAA